MRAIFVFLVWLKGGMCADESVLPAPANQACLAAVFDVIETKMNRTRTIAVPLNTSVRYNTLVIQPESCTTQIYAGDHENTTVYVRVWTLPYRVMVEPDLVKVFPPTPAFSGLMSTISPTFAHSNYAIIPVGCQMVQCHPSQVNAG